MTFLCLDIEEKGVRMKLTVIDTPGFGDQINNENWWADDTVPILKGAGAVKLLLIIQLD